MALMSGFSISWTYRVRILYYLTEHRMLVFLWGALQSTLIHSSAVFYNLWKTCCDREIKFPLISFDMP